MDSIFLFLSTILVMLMIPALALFYGGMVQSKNVLSTTMHSYTSLAVVSVQWILIGYSLAFGPDVTHLIGSFSWFGLNHVGFSSNPDYSSTVPHSLFMMFQMMFAALTPAIMSGAFAERMKFSSFVLFILLWTTLVYDPIAHWVWGVGGWLRNIGALDFAGGTVVHIASGVSGLVVALVLGKRTFIKEAKSHNIPLSILGAGLLWFGWYGFNVGSALTLNSVAINALITTTVATAVSGIAWMFCESVINKKPTAIGASNGIVAGLVAITPACGFVSPVSSIIIGLVSGVICYYAVAHLKNVLKYDDTLDAFGIHGFGGIWGAIATGLFASIKINSTGANGLFEDGGFSLLLHQFIAVGSVILFAGLASYTLIKFVNFVLPARVEKEVEEKGLDEASI